MNKALEIFGKLIDCKMNDYNRWFHYCSHIEDCTKCMLGIKAKQKNITCTELRRNHLEEALEIIDELDAYVEEWPIE